MLQPEAVSDKTLTTQSEITCKEKVTISEIDRNQ